MQIRMRILLLINVKGICDYPGTGLKTFHGSILFLSLHGSILSLPGSILSLQASIVSVQASIVSAQASIVSVHDPLLLCFESRLRTFIFNLMRIRIQLPK